MAESTDLMVTEGAGNSAADASGQSGEKQSIVDKLANFDMLRQVVVILALAICVAIAIFIMLWAQESTFRPLA